MLNMLRWLVVLPGAIVGVVVALFPLHFVLYQTLTGSGIVEPYPQLPERLLGPLVSALAFVWAGSWRRSQAISTQRMITSSSKREISGCSVLKRSSACLENPASWSR